MRGMRRRLSQGLGPFLWLLADAALVALVAGPAEVLLLFLLSPDLPLVSGGFLATLVGLLPQILVVFVLAGPLLVLLGTALSVGRTTRRGLSVRYILRFGLLDASLLALASLQQWRSAASLLPDPARTALALTNTALVLTSVAILVLVVVDMRRPGKVGAPWAVSLALGLLVVLGIAGELRRVRLPAPHAASTPGFSPGRNLLILDFPGLNLRDAEDYAAHGVAPALAGLLQRGAVVPLAGGPIGDPLALHATLISGRDPLGHGILGTVRYQPRGSSHSFGILPRGLFLRPLLRTPLWERVPVNHTAMRAIALPGIAKALHFPLVMIAAPLNWPTPNPESAIIKETQDFGACPEPPGVAERFFDPPAGEMSSTAGLETVVKNALRQDLCALEAARRHLGGGNRGILFVRLGGHNRVAYQFAGWRAESPARGVSDRDIEAYGRVLTRYVRELDPALGNLLQTAGPDCLIALVSTHGTESRQDLGRLVEALFGMGGVTGSQAGPPDGFLTLVGQGIQPGRIPQRWPLTSVLPTLLWALDLPAAEDMGPILQTAFQEEERDRRPVVMVPSFSL